jgi:putative mycofactocin binding protein MftB
VTATTTPSASSLLDRRLELHPQVALRPEPFGALAYHYGNRKLIFLKHPDVVRVVQSLADHDTLADTLRACDIDPARWPSFERALASLTESEMLHERHEVAPG